VVVVCLHSLSLPARPVGVSRLGVRVSTALTRKLRDCSKEFVASDVGVLLDHSASLQIVLFLNGSLV
jgi:hypothetical protein